MKNQKGLAKDKKGVSSLFIAIYTALLAVLLISTLFFGLVVSRSGLTEYLKVEQERMQESIRLSKLVTDSNDLYVVSVQVNNTGAITVRIRALYIDEEFICDPSTFEEDAYIEPKEHLNITLFPRLQINFDEHVLNAQWTVTTERGTRSSELGRDLWEETGGPVYSPNKFYFGPLMILFDMFHWRSGTDPWKSGWTIPQKAKDVTWRILLTNVDNREIVINDTSCFTLVGNEQQQNKIVSWFVNPQIGSMTFTPGKWYYVYYTWASPYSKSGTPQPQTPSGLTVGIPCINFLTFAGYFKELNGTTTPFGQTIPFEAVLITDETMVDSVTLTADPANIKNDGASTSTITAKVTDSGGGALANMWVDFYTSSGTLSETRKQTDVNGIAQVTLTSSTRQTTASVVAISQGVSGNCKVTFTPASGIKVTANPNVTSKNGGTSRITVQLIDSSNSNVTQSDITVTVRITSWTGGSRRPTLTNATYTGSSVIVTTDPSGSAFVTLTAQGRAGTATITASASGLSYGSTTVLVQ